MTISMVPVTGSSSVAATAHDPETDTLHVQFKSGGKVYTYPGVTAEEHQALRTADSIGKHLHRHFGQR